MWIRLGQCEFALRRLEFRGLILRPHNGWFAVGVHCGLEMLGWSSAPLREPVHMCTLHPRRVMRAKTLALVRWEVDCWLSIWESIIGFGTLFF